MNNIKMICPICGEPLLSTGKSFVCTTHHSFDIAKQGYVNLLPVQNKKSLHPGDTREMLNARRNFLNSGIYLPICNEVAEKACELTKNLENISMADIGCGEGYYTTAVRSAVNAQDCIGIDISKDAVKMACSRSKDIVWAVATAGCLPIEDESIDIITAVFSLISKAEFSRILKHGGYIIEVTAGNNHLIELKEIIYDSVYIQHKQPAYIDGDFTEISRTESSFTFTLNNSQLKELLLMTPHLWRIKKENREKLDDIPQLKLTANYWLRVLKKK
ncbi:MAG: methyltransferase domain-containing protein [Ruminococcus sp.]|nr:methyltransferase domain-containing protein [Ruminococcus sp.]MDD6447085.1 methyltransferase domain-containing protein [Ruminococcus sp.]